MIDQTFKSKQTEEELEDTRAKMRAFHLELNEQKEKLGKLQQRAEEAEIALLEARKALDQEKQSWKAELQQRVDEDRSKWREDLTPHSPFGPGRAESPAPSSHRNLTADLLGLQNLQTRAPTRSFTNDLAAVEGRMSRKSSAQHGRSSGQGTPQRQDSAQSVPNGDVSELPSIHTGDHDDYFDHVLSPSPTHQTMQDVLSVSTVGAGPSVQLVERMSAAVRRLESEKVSTKEELRRLSGQRDEARAQIVTLMQEVEAKRALDLRIKELEDENQKINARYQTTLEMLGEKSELVEELRADVQDVKDMYRELVERTVK
jgi:DNA repair exonuclease SbcCD ATPase subunit